MTRGVRPWRGAIAVVLAALLLLLVPAAPASAHAVLVSSDPADGARLEAAPAAVRLTFDEPVLLAPGAAVVVSSTGVRVGLRARPAGRGRSVVVPLRRGVGAGVYSVSWRVVSADSHLVTGSIRFGVRRDADAVAGRPAAPSPLDGATAAATGLGYLGLALGLGAPAAAALCWPSLRGRRRVRRVALAGLVLAAVAAVAELLLRGPSAAGSGWAGVLRFDGLGATLTTPAGAVLLVRLTLLAALAALVPRLDRRPVAVVGLVLGTALLASVAVLGHASEGAPALLLPAAVLHLAAMAVWLGGLVLLLSSVLPRFQRTPAAGLRALRRWSVVAFTAVAVLVVTGEVQAFPAVAPLDSLWATDYGRVLLLKLALVAGVLALAAWAQRVVAQGAGTARARLRISVALEAAGVATVLAVTAVLTGTATAAETYGPAVTRTVAIGADRLVVDVDRTRRGGAVLAVDARDAAGRPVRLESLRGSLAGGGVAGLDVRFRRAGTGWRSTDATLPAAGEWTLTLSAGLDDGTASVARVSWPVW